MKKYLFVPLIMSVLAVLFLLTPMYGALAAGKPIKIGIIGPMDMRMGNHLFITAQMAAEKINSSGGVKVGNTKRPIELVRVNSNEFRKVSDAVAAAERAITADKVNFLIGGILPVAVSAIQDIAADTKTIYISTSIVSSLHVERMEKNYNRYKYCFIATGLFPADIVKIHLGIMDVVSKAIRQKGVDKVKVAQMVQKTDEGDRIIAATSQILPKMGMEVVGSWRPSPSASDLRAETAAIRASGANMIYTVFYGAGGVIFGNQLAELKVPAIVVGSPARSGIPGQGNEYSVAMMSAATVRVKITDENIAWYDEFLKRSKGQVNSMSTYDAIMGLAASIEKVGSLDANALVKAMESEEYSGIVGVKKYDPKDHRTVFLKGYRPVYGIQQLPNYKYAVVWPTDAAVKAQPVQIPQWMIDAWKKAK